MTAPVYRRADEQEARDLQTDDPYSITYPEIIAIADRNGTKVELIEQFDCIGGAMWSGHHYRKSPLVKSVRNIGNAMRYLLVTGKAELGLASSSFPAGISGVEVGAQEIHVSYIGMGGGGVGASICRANARGVLRAVCDPAGGSRLAGAEIWVPRRERVLIGVDDTDTPEAGATWTLAHNIGRAVEDDATRYISHTIVQLFPVPEKTKNCVSTVCEFATTEPERLVRLYRRLLEKYTLSPKTGMAVFRGFDPSPILGFARKAKRGYVSLQALEDAGGSDLSIEMDGKGIIGAIAAIPFYCNYTEALSLWNGSH
ncbi:MAG: DUF1743 domain-containing protein [Methanomicrobiales archaeon]|nr:DUF1743 domain-containing protein [Methanomicrobiales archaeon]